MTVITEPCLAADVDEATYHRGRQTPTESLSYSGMKDILPPSTPAHFRYRRDNPPESRDAFDLGTAFHTLVLGRGDKAVKAPYKTWQTQESRDWRDAERAKGNVPLKPGDYERTLAMQESVLRRPRAAEILCDPSTEFELSAYALDPFEDSGIWIRSRFDVRHAPSGLWDVKTTAGLAAPAVFERKAYDFGYHGQSLLYRRVHEAITGQALPFGFMVVEVDPPHEISFVQTTPEFDALAEADIRQAIRTFAACQASGEWPGYGDDIHLIQPPPWAKTRAVLDVPGLLETPLTVLDTDIEMGLLALIQEGFK